MDSSRTCRHGRIHGSFASLRMTGLLALLRRHSLECFEAGGTPALLCCQFFLECLLQSCLPVRVQLLPARG